MSPGVDVAEVISPAFYPIHWAIKDELAKQIWLKGGRGSTKSSFTAIQIVLGIILDKNANAICLRKVGDTVRTSLFTTFLWAINLLGVEDKFSQTIAPATITYLPTGQKIFMRGLDEPQKLKSVKAEKGYFKFLWFEEASEFNGMDEIRSVEQSVLRGGETFVEFITYNPPNDPAAWVNKESLIEAPFRLVHSSTYLDVPRDWLGGRFIELAEILKLNDPLKYDHEYMGRAVGRAEQIVFYGKYKVWEFETPPLNQLYQNRYFYGVDWGFANDPTAATRSFIMNNELYIDYEAGGTGIEFEDIPTLLDKIPDIRRWRIYADSARPETISYVARKQFNIIGVPKWKGSVEDGIEYLKSFNKINVHPRCVKLIEEFSKYSYKIDKHTQEILPVLVDDWNHYIDTLRYGLNDYIQTNVSIFDVLD